MGNAWYKNSEATTRGVLQERLFTNPQELSSWLA